MSEAPSAREADASSARVLKPYHPPVLRELGTVADLTSTEGFIDPVALDGADPGYVNAS